MHPLEILFRDDHYTIINKPNHLLVHRSGIAFEDKVFALNLLRDQCGYWVTPVHRLDRPTSGVLVFANSPEAAGALSRQFSAHTIEKSYLAVVRGWMKTACSVNYSLTKSSTAAPQTAQTYFNPLARVEIPCKVSRYPTARYTFLEALPQTGRMHQIRKHLKHLRHYLIGDTTYGERHHNRFFKTHFQCPDMLLHSARLCFEHPFTRKKVVVTAPPPPIYVKTLQSMGCEDNLETYLAREHRTFHA